MGELAIRVENLGKRFVLGDRSPYRTVKESLTEGASSAWRRLGFSRPSGHRRAEPDVLWALRNVSFEVHTGEVLGIIGRNGAGKTTALMLLARIMAPTEGRAEIWGSVSTLLGIGTGFHGDLTGRENVFLNGAILGMGPTDLRDKFDAIVDFADLERFIDTPVKRYSRGMHSRLAFAVAAFLDPDILLVDEVLAAGDGSFQRKCRGKISEVASRGRTVLLVSHNLGAISDLTTRCLLLDAGRVVVDDTPEKAISAYLGRTAGFAYRRNLRDSGREPGVSTPRAWEFTFVSINTPPSGLVANRPLKVDLDFHSYRVLHDLAVEVSICSTNGTRLISTCSDDGGIRVDAHADQTGTLHVELDAPHLPAGVYLLELRATSGGNRSVDAIREALQFRILPDVSDTFVLKSLGETNLGLRLPARWGIEPVARAETESSRQALRELESR